MTVTLDLKPETETRLWRKAERAGQSLPDYLRTVADAEAEDEETPVGEISAFDLFEGLLGQVTSRTDGQEAKEAQTPGSSPADLFTGRLGRLKSSAEVCSQNCGQRFTDYLLEKQHDLALPYRRYISAISGGGLFGSK